MICFLLQLHSTDYSNLHSFHLVDMGSAESHLVAGVFPGDSQRDEDLPQFLTPDLLERTWLDLDPSPDLEMPWEKGIWGSIFCDKPLWANPQPKWKRLACPPDPQREQLGKPTKVARRFLVADHWRQIVANTDAVSWKEDQEAKMDVALKRWFDIISQFSEIHETVKQLHLLAGLAEQLRMLRDILSGKAPATLIKRANSVLKYIEKLREAKIQVPGDEAFLYAYFCDLRNSGVALSRLRSIVEAIRFTEFVFGIDGLSQKLLSKRCIGASRRVGETVLKQSDPFTVEQLAVLSSVCQAQDQRVQDQESECLERWSHGSSWPSTGSGAGKLGQNLVGAQTTVG